MFLVSCSTGSSNVTHSFMDYLCSAKVRTVAGFQIPVEAQYAKSLATDFLTKLFTNKMTIAEAESNIRGNTNSYYGEIIEDFLIKGEKNHKLAF